jgi:predicted acylesterase/phospholipase RssA
LEILLRSTTLAGSNRVNTNKTNADFYIKPDLTRFGMLEFKAADAIIEAGYEAGLAALDKELKNLL